MLTVDWHWVPYIAYFVTSNYRFFDENYLSMSGINMLKHLMLCKKSWSWRKVIVLALKVVHFDVWTDWLSGVMQFYFPVCHSSLKSESGGTLDCAHQFSLPETSRSHFCISRHDLELISGMVMWHRCVFVIFLWNNFVFSKCCRLVSKCMMSCFRWKRCRIWFVTFGMDMSGHWL